MAKRNLPLIEIGYQVFANEGGEEFGAVRYVAPDNRPEIIVYIENRGDFTIPLGSVRAVHDGKVVVDVAGLPDVVQSAIAHAHDREQPDL
jgi:hypothetical protein